MLETKITVSDKTASGMSERWESIGGTLFVGLIPLVLLFTGYGGWAALVSVIPAIFVGSAIGAGIDTIVAYRS